MAHKLDSFRQQILDFKADGESVRSIASKLTELSGEKIAASTVHHFLKQGNGNGERKESPSMDTSVLESKLDTLQVSVSDLQAQLKRIETSVAFVRQKWGTGEVLTAYECVGAPKHWLVICVERAIDFGDWLGGRIGDCLLRLGILRLKQDKNDGPDFWISPSLRVMTDEVNDDRP